MQLFEKSRSIVAFIDILGFKEIVKANDKSKDNFLLYQLKDALQQSFNKSIIVMEQWLSAIDKIENKNFASKLKYRQFSDNLYFSFDYNDDKSDYELAVYLITMMSAYYQRIMLSKNFYVRGGIADGKNYFDEHIIFSGALIKAYEFETKTAKYPRIIIDKKILKSLPKDNFIKKVLPNIFVKDWAGLVFLNPFKIITSLTDMFAQYPEIIPKLDKIAKGNPSLLNASTTLNLEPDILDGVLTELVWDNLKVKLKKHKYQPELYEKNLWLREFVDWQDDYESNLNFKYC